jgi:aminoglycoside phosphotransferase (APT) family kinase protein
MRAREDPMTLPAEVTAWIEQRCGGRIVEVERQVRWRPHHFVTLERPGGERVTVVVRAERPPLAQASSPTDIAREAQVLEALQGRGLKVPGFLGFHPQHRILLMSHVRGVSDFAKAADDATRHRLMCGYFEQLAALHRIDLGSRQLASLKAPASPHEAAFGGMYGYLESLYLAGKAELPPDPLLELAHWWAHAHPPAGERELRLLQGDTGPGQFMFEGDQVTALIDWELAEIGDAMKDLAIVRIRNMLYPTGSLRRPLAHYEQASGRPIDWRALSFFSVLQLLGLSMGGAASVRRPDARIPDMVQRIGWDASFRRGLAEALAEAVGVADQSVAWANSGDAPLSDESQGARLAGFLADQLELNCLPLAADEAGREALANALATARALRREAELGAKALADDLDDMAGVLGARPADRPDGLAQLSALVRARPGERLAELAALFVRIERRREHLLAPIKIHQAAEPFERLAPAAG